jgi:NaMN:DMB phosphoribosyltransferase
MSDQQSVGLINDDALVNTSRRLSPAPVNETAEQVVRKAFTQAGAGAFGRLADFASWWAGRSASNDQPSRVRLLVFVSAGSTAPVIMNLPSKVTVRHVVIPGTVSEAASTGSHVIDDEVDGGTDLILIGHAGNDLRSLATALVVHATGADLVDAMGTDLDDLIWMGVAQNARESTRALRACPPDEVLQQLASPDMAALVAALNQAAVRGVPVLIDGTAVAAAAVAAERISPGSSAWWCASHRSRQRAQVIALESLNMEPMIDLGLHIGDGRGALLALPLLLASIEVAQDLIGGPVS